LPYIECSCCDTRFVPGEVAGRGPTADPVYTDTVQDGTALLGFVPDSPATVGGDGDARRGRRGMGALGGVLAVVSAVAVVAGVVTGGLVIGRALRDGGMLVSEPETLREFAERLESRGMKIHWISGRGRSIHIAHPGTFVNDPTMRAVIDGWADAGMATEGVAPVTRWTRRPRPARRPARRNTQSPGAGSSSPATRR
jgi:hypothetical protein